jgi:hypothetical protein
VRDLVERKGTTMAVSEHYRARADLGAFSAHESCEDVAEQFFGGRLIWRLRHIL